MGDYTVVDVWAIALSALAVVLAGWWMARCMRRERGRPQDPSDSWPG